VGGDGASGRRHQPHRNPEAALSSRPGSRVLSELRGFLSDALYRGSAILLINQVIAAALGFVFWTLAAHRYSASTVGVFSSVIAGTGLLAAIAALGWQNTMMRHVSGAQNSRELVSVVMATISTVGAVLCLITVLTLGPHLPASLGLRQRGSMVALVTVLTVFTAISGIVGAGLVAMRASHAVLITDLIGSVTQIVALIVLASLRSTGLLISYGLGLALAASLATVVLIYTSKGKRPGIRSFLILRRYLSVASGNYLATILGMLPASIMPLEALLILGPTDTARFVIAGKVSGFLVVIPSTVAGVYFAEASRRGASRSKLLRQSLRGVYLLLVPAAAVVAVGAPWLLDLFGASYSAAATGCLRVLAVGTLLSGGTYLIDSVLVASDRMVAYVFINGANAALVLALVGVLLPHGLTAAALGWVIAQAISLVIGVILVTFGQAGRHRRGQASDSRTTSPTPAA
jgi:O-antigen/teichoic acid export membrane protein